MASIVGTYMRLLQALRIASGVIVFFVFVLIVTDVFVRLFGFKPWLFANILVEYGLLWFTMLAAPYLVRIKGHVFIDAVTQLLPDGARGALAKLVYLICVAATLIFAWYSLDLLIIAIEDGQIDTRAEDMPLWSLLLPLPFCFFLVSLEFGRFLIGLDDMYGDRKDERASV